MAGLIQAAQIASGAAGNVSDSDTQCYGYVYFTGVTSDGEKVLINSRNYEFDNNAAWTGDVQVDISGGNSAAQSATALAAAINTDASRVVDALVAGSGDTITVCLIGRSARTAFSLSTTCVNGVVSGANMIAGNAAAAKRYISDAHVFTAADYTKFVTMNDDMPIGGFDDVPGMTPRLVGVSLWGGGVAGLQMLEEFGMTLMGCACLLQQVNSGNWIIVLGTGVKDIPANSMALWLVVLE